MSDPVIERYQERLMQDPVTYIKLLRRQSALHCVWHAELQERIEDLENGRSQMVADLDRLIKVIQDVAAVMESYPRDSTASGAKLHRYANTLREAL